MREHGEEILRPIDPAIWDAVKERLDEILVDELGHMMVLWSTCSRFEITALSWITKFFQFFVERAFGAEPDEHHDRLLKFFTLPDTARNRCESLRSGTLFAKLMSLCRLATWDLGRPGMSRRPIWEVSPIGLCRCDRSLF